MEEHISLPRVLGELLDKMGSKHKNMLILDSDLGNNLHTLHFAKNFPERHFTIGQGESAMLAMASGMTVRKKIPVVCAESAPLLGKGLDMLRNAIAIPNLNIKIILSGSGLDDIDQGTHKTASEDLAILKALPNLKIFTPSDQYELRAMLEWTLNDYGPTVIRVSKHLQRNYFDGNYQFVPGKPVIIQPGEQICIFTAGSMLEEASLAARELGQRGLSAQLVHLSSLEPLNAEEVVELARNFENIVTIEDHSVHGGIGTVINEILSAYQLPRKILKIGLSGLAESGKYQDCLSKYGLSAKAIYEKIRENWINS